MTFTEILDKYGVEYWTEGKYTRQGWIQLHCPFCTGGTNPDKPYMGYNPTSNAITCWRCGIHPVGHTIQILTGVPWKEVKELLPDLETDEYRKETKRLQGKLKLPKDLVEILGTRECRAHREYLYERGSLPGEIVRLWDIKGICTAPRLGWRLFIPIYHQGRVVSWTTRGLTDKEPRYVSASPEEEAISHKEICYGGDYVGARAIVVEGPLDVWRIGPGAIATLGTNVTLSQLAQIAQIPYRVIAFDVEPAAQERAERLCDSLSILPGETYKVVLDSNDPGSATDKEIKKLRRLLR